MALGAEYLPIRDLSYLLDVKLYGLDHSHSAMGFRLTNLILYLAVVVAVYAFLLAALRQPNLAFLATAFFAVHPLHSESVAWIASRKDLLAGLFFFLALRTYISWVTGRRSRR